MCRGGWWRCWGGVSRGIGVCCGGVREVVGGRARVMKVILLLMAGLGMVRLWVVNVSVDWKWCSVCGGLWGVGGVGVE